MRCLWTRYNGCESPWTAASERSFVTVVNYEQAKAHTRMRITSDLGVGRRQLSTHPTHSTHYSNISTTGISKMWLSGFVLFTIRRLLLQNNQKKTSERGKGRGGKPGRKCKNSYFSLLFIDSIAASLSFSWYCNQSFCSIVYSYHVRYSWCWYVFPSLLYCFP